MPTTADPAEALNSRQLCGLLDAKRTYHLGVFRVRFQQVEFHKHLRLQDPQWIDKLRLGMEEGVDREQYPIQAILRNDDTWRERGGHRLAGDGSEFLPEGIIVIVYDGRHRVEAWKECAGSEQDKWWYTTIYKRALETEKPGEFYSMMHIGNETESRKPHVDSDRFLLVHRLRCLLQTRKIDTDTYRDNAKRIMGPSGSTARAAIPSLVRSASVSTAIANLVEYPELRPTFSASGWKKLTEGRLYTLIEWVLEEAHEQFKLLKGSTLQADPAAFTLSASQCRWEALETAVKKADHPWHSLEGGGEAALARVRQRPSHRALLNPLDRELTDRTWTFPDRVLLPNVLTSNTVTDSLTIMKDLSQHLVHIIVGVNAFKDYCSKHAKDSEECSPGVYVNKVLGHRAFHPDGRPKNFAQKVFHHMWSHRRELIAEIQNMMLTKPLETSVAEYQELIDGGQAWYRLLCLFKMRHFPHGLDIVIQTIEERRDARSAPSPPASSQSGSFIEASAGSQSYLAQPPDSTHRAGQEVALGEAEEDAVNDTIDASCSLTLTEDVVCSNDKHDGDHTSKRPPGQMNTVVSRRKRKRDQAGEELAEDGGYHPSPSELRALVEGVPSGEPAEYGHRRLNASMKRLENKARNLEREQARAMSELIEALLEVPPSQVFMNVAKRLKDEIPRLTRKAIKLVKNDYEDDELDGGSGPSSRPGGDTNRIVATAGGKAAWRHELVKLIGDSETEDEQDYVEEKSSGHSGGGEPNTS